MKTEKLWRIVEERLKASHGIDHIRRVHRLAVEIGKRENADIEIIEVSAILHDIERDKDNHAYESAKTAEEILTRLSYPRTFIEKVAHCIEAHSFSGNKKPETLEAKILSDADKLDAMGAVGIARAFMFAGETGRDIFASLKHFEEKLLNLYSLLHTQTAREIGYERYKFLKEFYEHLMKELEMNA